MRSALYNAAWHIIDHFYFLLLTFDLNTAVTATLLLPLVGSIAFRAFA